MRILVIGGTGHIGSFLVPDLVRAGHHVTVVSRGARSPYALDHPGHRDAWDEVERLTCDREAAEADGSFGALVASARPETVVDLTCFTLDQARHLAAHLDGQHLVHTGSIWAHGRSTIVPTTEASPKHPFGEYGIAKAALEEYWLHGQDRVRATVVHPGHISGPGWPAINPAGNLDPKVLARLRADGACLLPDEGMGLLQHVHAADVAALHQRALEQPEAAAGEAFNAVATSSLTLRGYAELLATHFGHEPELEFLPWQQWAETVGADNAEVTWDHVSRSPHHSMAKAHRLLDFTPRHSIEATVIEAAQWQVDMGEADTGKAEPRKVQQGEVERGAQG